MRVQTSYATDGTAALAMQREPRLRLVYDSRYDAKRNHRNNRRGARPGFGALLVISMILVASALSTYVSNARYASVQQLIEGAQTETICVTSGDTLWTVAAEHEVPGTNTADVVEWIKTHNELDSSMLKPGQRLVVPFTS